MYLMESAGDDLFPRTDCLATPKSLFRRPKIP